jgi:predicted permease
MLSDLKLAFRQLAKSPGFAAIAILTLGLAIGANTAIFSALNAALLRPLPYPHAGRLVEIHERTEAGGRNSVAGGAFLDWRENSTRLDSITLVHGVTFNLRADGPPERLDGLEVSPEFLRVFGVAPLFGRGFTGEDGTPGGDNAVVILTEELWRSRFGADEKLVGSRIVLDDVPRTIIGIAPAGTWIYRDVQFFVPVVLPPNTDRTRRDGHWASVYGRLQPGASVTEAETELNGIKLRLQSLYPAWKNKWGVSVASLSENLAREARPALLVLLGAVAFVLLIACANVANLLLARSRDRRTEIAVRAALGASGAQLMRQVLVESLLLSTLGGILGILLASWGIDFLRHLTADFLPRAMAPSLDLRVLGFSLAVSTATGLLFGLLPAWHARRPDLNAALKSGGRGATSGGRTRTQAVLVITEVALTVILLTGAGLLFRSLVKTTRVDVGFDPAHVLAFDLALPDASYASNEQRLAFTRAALDRIRALPGVEAAGTGLAVPFAGGGYGEYFSTAKPDNNFRLGRVDFISGGYLEGLGVRLLSGRTLADADNYIGAPPVAVINDAAARAVFPDEDPIGQTITFRGRAWTIIGVITDIPDRKLDRAPRPFAYAPQAFIRDNYSMVVRTKFDPRTLVTAVRAEIQRLDPGLPLANVRTLDEAMSGSMTERRLILGLIGAFTAVALLLACLGLYGVMAYSVVIRRRELSIRLALGAAPAAVRDLVLRDGLRLTLIGLVVGIAGALASARLITAFLFGTSPHDPVVIAVTTALLLVMAVVSCWLPARRATRVDPMVALRAE